MYWFWLNIPFGHNNLRVLDGNPALACPETLWHQSGATEHPTAGSTSRAAPPPA